MCVKTFFTLNMVFFHNFATSKAPHRRRKITIYDIITDKNMPSWNIHLEAGMRLVKKLKFTKPQKDEFLFGCLLPDINNGYINQVKTRKHHCETHYAFNQKSSLNFYAENKSQIDAKEPIFLGYLFHLYTDGYFNYDFFRTIKHSKLGANLDYDEKTEIKHHDFWIYDSNFHHCLGIEEPSEFRRLAKLANTINAAEIEPEDISDIERILTCGINASVKKEPYKFYTEERLNNLIDSVVESFSKDYLEVEDA